MRSRSNRRVILAGNPNAGKSSLFNALTGLNQKISNISGTTVERKKGKLIGKPEIELIDLPGVYSIYPSSADEYVALEPLISPEHPDRPDLIIQVLDASNLKRNLLFATQIADLGFPMVWCLNMEDIAVSRGIEIDAQLLEAITGFPVIKLNARKSRGLDEIISRIESGNFFANLKFYESDKPYDQEVLGYFDRWNDKFRQDAELAEAEQRTDEIDKRYEQIDQIISKVVSRKSKSQSYSLKLDRWLVHPVMGPLIFGLILFVIFQFIFNLAEYPMNWIEMAFGSLANQLHSILPDNWFSSLITDGLIPGIAGVVVFVPQILLLFLFLGIMEDTGYMARVSFMMDRFVRRFGLNGKSVVPMVSGAACAIPAIMASRHIDNWKDRIITIMVTPLISCSARLPVYILLIGLFVPDKNIAGIFNLQGIMLMLMYLIGVGASLVSALVFKWILRNTPHGHFIQELPVYHLPRWLDIVLHAFQKSKSFVVEAGKVIVIVSILLWFMASFGPARHRSLRQVYLQTTDHEQKAALNAQLLELSYAGMFGKAIEPAIKPLGFNWKIGIALITSFAAREVFVGTMYTIYSLGDEESSLSLQRKMKSEKNADGTPVYNAAVALSLMIFYAFAMQCASTLAVVRKETASLKWPLIQFVYMAIMAYAGSLITFQVARFWL